MVDVYFPALKWLKIRSLEEFFKNFQGGEIDNDQGNYREGRVEIIHYLPSLFNFCLLDNQNIEA